MLFSITASEHDDQNHGSENVVDGQGGIVPGQAVKFTVNNVKGNVKELQFAEKPDFIPDEAWNILDDDTKKKFSSMTDKEYTNALKELRKNRRTRMDYSDPMPLPSNEKGPPRNTTIH